MVDPWICKARPLSILPRRHRWNSIPKRPLRLNKGQPHKTRNKKNIRNHYITLAQLLSWCATCIESPPQSASPQVTTEPSLQMPAKARAFVWTSRRLGPGNGESSSTWSKPLYPITGPVVEKPPRQWVVMLVSRMESSHINIVMIL